MELRIHCNFPGKKKWVKKRKPPPSLSSMLERQADLHHLMLYNVELYNAVEQEEAFSTH